MRVIKFRVWDKERKGFLHQIDIDSDIIYVDTRWYIHGGHALDDNYVMQQYTGIKDENGKEIYEGDIIFCKAYYGIENRVGIVDYFASSFIVDWRNQIDDPLDEIPDIMVIGNIFENPELLK
jgi:uncharacterized phage protein (TIGR01671 family)